MKRKLWFLLISGLTVLLAFAFHDNGLKHMTSTLETEEENKVGEVTVAQLRDGRLRVSLSVHDMPPGPHAVHVHEVGVCTIIGNVDAKYDSEGMYVPDPNWRSSVFKPKAEDFQTAGEHLNPDGKAHGFRNPAGHHVGDFDHDLLVGSNGKGHVSYVVDDLSLFTNAPNDIYRHSVIVDERGDDGRTQPSGNSGRHIACSEIELPPPTGVGQPF